MTTATGLTFTGDIQGNFLALDTSTGKTLWHAGSGGAISTSPSATCCTDVNIY